MTRGSAIMPRQARLNAPGTLHHVMPQNIERHPLFRDEQDGDELENGGRRF